MQKILLSTNTFKLNNLVKCKNITNSKKNLLRVSNNLKDKAKNMLGAMAVASMVIGGLSVSSCAKDDYLGDNSEYTNFQNILDLVKSHKDSDYINYLQDKNAGQKTDIIFSNLLGLQSHDDELQSGLRVKTYLVSDGGDTLSIEVDNAGANIDGKYVQSIADGSISFANTVLAPISKNECLLYENSVPVAVLSNDLAMTRTGNVAHCITKISIGPDGKHKTEIYSLDSQNAISTITNNYRKANTPLKRLDILREELNIGTGDNPPAYDIYGTDKKHHNPITYTINKVTPEKVLISAVQVDFEHTFSGVEFVSEVTSGKDGTLNIKRTATGGDLSGQTHGPEGFTYKGAVENISIKANDDGSFTEEKINANGKKMIYKIAKDDEGYYRLEDGKSVKERIGTENRAVSIEFNPYVADYDNISQSS